MCHTKFIPLITMLLKEQEKKENMYCQDPSANFDKKNYGKRGSIPGNDLRRQEFSVVARLLTGRSLEQQQPRLACPS